MRTEDLIAALAVDTRREPSTTTFIFLAALVGGAASLALFLALMGVRSDIAAALVSWRFDLKLVIVAVALTVAVLDCIRLARPLPTPAVTPLSLLVPGLLAVGIALELYISPAETWRSKLVGTNALMCLVAIPALSVAPLAAALFAMKRGAPTRPAAAGAAVGQLAAALAAILYALHCFDDSPLFVAFWYALAMLPAIACGALGGRRILQW